MAPAYALVAGILSVAYTGAVGVSFSVAGVSAKVRTDTLQTNAVDANGFGFYQFGLADLSGSGTPAPNTETIIPDATLTNLCQSVTVTQAVPVVGNVSITLRLTAGDAGTPVHAANLVIDASTLSATTATFHDISIGQDMGTFSNPALKEPDVSKALQPQGSSPAQVNVPRGTFGQVAHDATITGVQQVSSGTAASTFTLPHLNLAIGVTGGATAECF
jgi:hypothetical protein